MHVQKGLTRSLILALAATGAIFLASCGKKTETVKETNAAKTTAAQTTESATTAQTTAPDSTEASSENSGAATGTVSKLTAKTEVYEKGDIRIEYPVISGMEDTSAQDKLNAHLKENALSILENYPDSKEPMNQDEDSLDVTCNVISADSERVVVTYEAFYNMKGAAHPNNIFYTNTVETKSLKDISLSDVADPYTLAVYALSDDVVLKEMDPEIVKSYKEWQSSTTVEQYQSCLENADFPLQKSADGKTVTWPDSFSYESNGAIFFSVPVPHAMGDYVIVEFEVVTK